ncbi:GAF and ANTAR domain-containing protein [Streptomyces minutiscleroticus]|uniref:GAF and ANTAR domain-containing protein n=1 Tax=Streptomyces minutiscleroticus TaxID=68238 RepID=UPI00331B03A1
MVTTEREVRIAQAVSDLAHRPADADPLELLHDLTGHAVALLAVRGASITVLDHSVVSYVTASDETSLRLTEDQIILDEGPCLDSARTRTALAPTDLAAHWPHFASRARAEGVTAVAAVSLRLPQMLLGALNLLLTDPSSLDDGDMELAQMLADTAGYTLAHRRELADTAGVLAQLQAALDGRIVVEQAKGMLVGRFGISMDQALTGLRAHARAQQQRLTDLAAQIARGKIPAEFHPVR